jgi:hypothetical protein
MIIREKHFMDENIRSNKLLFEQALPMRRSENLINLKREAGFMQFISPAQIP